MLNSSEQNRPAEYVVHDDSARADCVNWAGEELVLGASFESVEQALVDGDWTEIEAVAIVEEARKITRAERGVVTRADVVRASNKHYRAAWNCRWIVAFPSIAFVVRLMYSAGSLVSMRKKSPRQRED